MRYKPQRPALKAPYPKVYLACLLGLINVQGLQPRQPALKAHSA